MNWALKIECIRFLEYVAEKSSPLTLKLKSSLFYIFSHTHDCPTNVVTKFKVIYKFNNAPVATSIVGSVVEFSPATREARVRFPDNAFFRK